VFYVIAASIYLGGPRVCEFAFETGDAWAKKKCGNTAVCQEEGSHGIAKYVLLGMWATAFVLYARSSNEIETLVAIIVVGGQAIGIPAVSLAGIIWGWLRSLR
jgi:hypothetical protein